MMLRLQAHGQGTMPAPYKAVWHDLMALLARDTQLRRAIEQHRAAVPEVAQMSPIGGPGWPKGAVASGEPSLPPPQHQHEQLPLPAAPHQQQGAELQQEAPPPTDLDEQMQDADSMLHGQLAALPPTTPKAASCSTGDARASLSGDDVPLTGGVVAAAMTQKHVMVGREDDTSHCERQALPAPPPSIAVSPDGAGQMRSSSDPASADCGTADASGASAGSMRRISTTAVEPAGQAASVPGQWQGVASPHRLALHLLHRSDYEYWTREGQL